MTHLRRGTTLIELLLGCVMMVAIIGATMSLFLFSAQRVAVQTAESSLQMQVAQLSAEFNKVLSQAKSCRIATLNGCSAIVAELPATGTDEDFDGVKDHFVPDASSGGKEIFNTGCYVWFYFSDTSGAFGVAGNRLWRAVKTAYGNPALSDVDAAWSRYYGGAYKWNLIDAVNFVVDTQEQSARYTIFGSALERSDRSMTRDLDAPGTNLTFSQQVYWQNFRNLIVNGSFEYPDVQGTGWGYYADDGLVGGWIKTSTTPFEIQFGSFGAQSYRGKQHLELDADVPGSIKQSIETEPGHQYTLSFFYTPRPGCSSNNIRVKWNGVTVAVLSGSGVGLPGSAAWTQYTYTVTATGTSTDLEFLDESVSGDKTGGLLDNVVLMSK